LSLLRTAYRALRDQRLLAVSVATVAAASIFFAVACTDVGTSPTTPVALAFDTLPSPAVVYGDTLRDINGLAAKLTGHAYNGDGREIADAPIEYFFSDSGKSATISDGYLIAKTDTLRKSFTVSAQVNRIRSPVARTVDLTWRPDSVDRGTVPIGKEDTLYYVAADTAKTLDASLSVRILSRYVPDPTKTDTVTRFVKSWLVKYRVLSPVAGDSVKADSLLVNDNGVRSSIDTTDGSGVAARKIRIRFPSGVTVPESVVIEARVRYKGAYVRGSPVRFVVRIRQSS
jgi:hypothetical protein